MYHGGAATTRPTVTGAAVTESVTYPWNRAERAPAVARVRFAQVVSPDPTAMAVVAKRWSGLVAVRVYRWGGTANAKYPAGSGVVSKVHGRSEASTRTSGPEAPAIPAEAKRRAAIAVATARTLEARWSVVMGGHPQVATGEGGRAAVS